MEPKKLPQSNSKIGERVSYYHLYADETFYATILEDLGVYWKVVLDDDVLPFRKWKKDSCDFVKK